MKLSGTNRRLDVHTLGQAFRTFRNTLHGQGRALTAALAVMLLSTACSLLRPWPVQYVVDEILLAGRTETLPLLLGCAAVVLLGALVGQLTVVQMVLEARIARKVATRIRRRLFGHLHRLALPFHRSHRTGDLLVRLMGDVDMVRDLMFASWLSLLGRAVVMAGAIAIMCALDPALALLALAPLPFLALRLKKTSRALTGATRKQRRRQGDLAAYAAESLRQIELVKAYAQEDRATDRFTDRTRSSERAGVKAARLAAAMTRTAEVTLGIGLGLVLFFGARRVAAGTLTVGQLLVVLSYTRMLYKPVRRVAREGARLAKATACAGRILEVLEIEPERRGGRPVPPVRGTLELRGVSYRHEKGHYALRGVDLDIPAGSLAMVSGNNGAGKSTLLGLLLRLYEPEEGELFLDGVPIRELDLDGYRSQIAYVPQGTLLLGVTVRENIAYGNPDATDEQIERAARLALVDAFIHNLPAGYETVLGENGATLSGGEARRLMLARAAVKEASLLFLDEPLAGLDPDARATVVRSIRRITKGRTTLIVHHGDAGELAPDLHIRLRAGQVSTEAKSA